MTPLPFIVKLPFNRSNLLQGELPVREGSDRCQIAAPHFLLPTWSGAASPTVTATFIWFRRAASDEDLSSPGTNQKRSRFICPTWQLERTIGLLYAAPSVADLSEFDISQFKDCP